MKDIVAPPIMQNESPLNRGQFSKNMTTKKQNIMYDKITRTRRYSPELVPELTEKIHFDWV